MPTRSKMTNSQLHDELEAADKNLEESEGALRVLKEARDGQVADLKGELAAAKKAPKGKKGKDPYHGLLPTVLHVSGVAWNGTVRCLVRCATSGPLAEKWLVRVGNQMITSSGHPIPFVPYVQVSTSLQPKVVWDLAEAIKYLSKH